MKNTLIAFLLLLPSFAYPITFGELTGKYNQYLDCTDEDIRINAICQELKTTINSKLQDANLKISNGSIIYSANPSYPYKKVHGHCSTQLYLRGGYFTVKANENSEIKLTGNAVSEPLILLIDIDAKIITRANIKLEYGNTLAFGSCNDYASDSGYVNGYANTNVRVISAFSLEPELLGMDSNGDYLVKISPQLKLVPEIENFELQDISVHGINDLVATTIGIISGYSELFYIDLGNSITNWILGESLTNNLTSAGLDFLTEHLAIPTILLIERFGGIEDFDGRELGIDFDTRTEIARQVAEYNSKLDKLFNGFEENANSVISEKLNLDSNGSRIFRVPGHLVPNSTGKTVVELTFRNLQNRRGYFYSVPEGLNCQVISSIDSKKCIGEFEGPNQEVTIFWDDLSSFTTAIWKEKDCGWDSCTFKTNGIKHSFNVNLVDSD